jgi:hypothetical protein
LLALFAATAAWAQPDLSFSVATGQYGMRKEVPHSLGIDFELRPAWRWNLVRPVAGLLTSSHGGAYIYSGLVVEIPLPGGLMLAPGFAPGVVVDEGDRVLGFPIEFRSSIELSWSPDNRLRMGLGLSHISNASLGDRNPGVEVLSFGFSFPLGG